MDVLDFFDRDKSLSQIRLPGAQVGGELTSPLEQEDTYVYEEHTNLQCEISYEYADHYRKEEETLCMKNVPNPPREDDFLRPDSPTTIESALRENDDAKSDMTSSIYAKYKFDHHTPNPDLSINSYQEQITDMICTNSVIVIQGPTGCGKTTQVPQFILDYCHAQNQYCKIAVTQPRRIAAISVARRVSDERGWPIGSIVGYQVGLDRQTSEDSIITYMTTGVLLQKLIRMKTLNHFTHIIVDEVHERDAEMDFLLLVVRRFLRTVSRSVKIILMSATIDVEHFANYFLVPRGNKLASAPVIDVSKLQPYTVNIYYLNQFDMLVNNCIPHFEIEEPVLHPSLYQLVLKLLRIFDSFDTTPNKYGSVLIFLPGIYEIQELYELLEKEKSDTVSWFLVPLHSSITVEEQRKAFKEPPAGHRKIILSTNIAESSITVPDVIYVIDFCLTKILRCDPVTNYSSLKLAWASHTNCQQRSGRVGRVASGRVYRLVPTEFYHEKLERDIEPEILRSPLHRLVLMSKMLGIDIPPEGILALAIDPPPLKKIEQNITVLKEAGALLITCNGTYTRNDGDLTEVGRIMSHLPLDVNVSKLIILGYMFSTLKECIIMAAAMSLQNIFSSPFNERMKAYQSKLSWADCSCSDLIAYLHVYVVWERNKYSNYFREVGGEKAWMKRNFLQPKVMQEWRNLVQEIKQRLNYLGLTEPLQGRQGNLTEHEKAMILKVVISGAFYPNFFVRSSEGGQIDESVAVRQLGGRDPFTTVYFSGKPENQPVELYVQSIRELLKECGQNLNISHDNSNKIYVQFKHDLVPTTNDFGRNNPLVPGKIAIEVYNAVKFRHNKTPSVIKCVSAEEAQRRVKQWKKFQAEKKKEIETESLVRSIVPGFDVSFIEIRISHVNNPGHFFAHNVENMEVMHTLAKIEQNLKTFTSSDIPNEIIAGKLYAAPFAGKLYRARVICVISAPNKESTVQVIFIDYGNVDSIPQSKLRHLLPDMFNIPPLALECVLANIQPSHEMNAHALWTKQATDEFIRLTNRDTVNGKIYSVVDNVVYLELYPKLSRPGSLVSINKILISKGLAQTATESFLSQDNHKKREYAQSNAATAMPYSSFIEWYDKFNEMPAPKPEECRMTMKLQGPYSPLEMKVFGILQCNLNKVINVEWSSVNSILLDSNPEDPHDRLLVAGSISQNIEGTKLSLRHTTIMPNIHGFPVLMALMFAPRMEIHTNKEGTRLTSILCGLGCDPNTKRSRYPAHDLALNLDFELNDNVVTKVNEIRYFMNNAVDAMSCYNTENTSTMSIETCQNEIRKAIRQLLKLQHKPMEREILPNTYQWGKLSSNIEIASPIYVNSNSIWMMHSSIKLKDVEKAEVTKHLSDLRDFGNKVKPMSEIVCKLCNIVLYDPTQVRIHVTSEIHKQNEKIFNGDK